MNEKSGSSTSGDARLGDTVSRVLVNFIDWLESYGETSWDYQSFFAGPVGGPAKALYYRHKLIGTAAVAPMIFCEAFLPAARRLFHHPVRFPIADAHYAMGFAFLYEATGDSSQLENAIHFSKKGGPVAIQVRPLGQLPQMPHAARARIAGAGGSDGFALIEISDSGPGIEDARKEKVFHTFHQTKQGKKSPGESLGLGLAISRVLVEAHHGTIWVEDNPSGGAIFFVLLPLGPE